ncbi:MAG TPA: sugar ABC transporter permease [Actinomycetota bacterium]|nr:sugar ABC transporter permease [Actinomycetota bacterium]
MSEATVRRRRWFGGREGAQKRFVAGVTLPAVAFMAVFSLLPIVWAFTLAFFDFSATRAGTPFLGLGGNNPFVGLEHFRAMTDFSADQPIQVSQFHTALKVTLAFAFLVVPINLAITLPLAAMIESVHQRARPIFRTIFFLPVLASSVGVAIIWGFVLHPQNGLLNGVISRITGRTTQVAWISDQSLVFLGIPVALLAVLIAYLWQDIGYNMVIFIAALQAIPQSVKDAARVDGASAWQTFRHITLPLLKPTILLASILTMISAFQVFDLFQVMTDGGPQEQTRALSLDIYRSAFRYQQMGWAAAVSVVLFAIVFVISLAQTRLLRNQWEY